MDGAPAIVTRRRTPMRSRRSLLAALLALPSLARAADLPVRYTVQEKPLKTAIAGTSLTFELFRDSACATAAVHSVSVMDENVTLITKLKQITPKGDTKLPSTDELALTLTGVTAAGNLYLKVTGTGIVPVGGACQAQAAQLIAANCVDGIQNQGARPTSTAAGRTRVPAAAPTSSVPWGRTARAATAWAESASRRGESRPTAQPAAWQSTIQVDGFRSGLHSSARMRSRAGGPRRR